MAKVYVRIFGGIGNQLFCYAAARRLAIKRGAELVIDSNSGFEFDLEYKRKYQLDKFYIPCRTATKRELFWPFPRIQRFICKQYNRLLPLDERTYIKQEGVDYDPRLLSAKVLKDVYIEGYWQSEGYFCDIEDVLRGDLKIRIPKDKLNVETAKLIKRTNSVALHVRFFDYEKNSTNNVSADYYDRAIIKMLSWVPDAHFYVFSDRIDLTKSFLKHKDCQFTFIDFNSDDSMAYADLWLMSLCKNFIIANSTFSWWGAWLSNYEDKRVIAPSSTISGDKTLWGFEGLLPESWVGI